MKGDDTVTLLSSDGEEFEVPLRAATQSITIRDAIEEAGGTEDQIPLPNVSGPILAKVLEYCSYHANVANAPRTDSQVKEWDEAFARVDQPVLFELILAANFLNVRSLLDLTCKTVADMIKGKSPEEIRQVLNIENDFSPEEEEEVRRENAWAFE